MTSKNDLSNTKIKEERIFKEVDHHINIGFDDTDSRATGRDRLGTISFNEADEMFRSWINEKKWPYDALIFDPRVFTFIFEKTSRLIANKPKGTLSPRNSSDTLAARINNALLDYQWDACTIGGSMIYKWSMMDINTRKYGAAFALTPWRYETDSMGRVVYDGPDMKVLNNRDCAHDLTATSIESCNWFLVRQYLTVQELERVNDAARTGPVYKNLDSLKMSVKNGGISDGLGGGDSRSTNWTSRNRSITGIEEDPYGKDPSFQTVEVVTEYRRDRWITVAPKHGVVLRDIPNPYGNNEIPIVMLRYYAIDDDLYGMSEIEPVKGLQKTINALVCQYVDEINIKLKTPIAIGPGVRQHTLGWGKNARWVMNNPMTDFRLVESRSNAASFFNNTYSVLVNAMMNALGESSLGVSNVQPYQTDKTATEVKALQLQRNARDNYNQIFLSEAIKRQYMLWHSMNQKLIFASPETTHYSIRLSGAEAVDYFRKRGLDKYSVNDEVLEKELEYQIDNGQGTGIDMSELSEPQYPINIGSEDEPKYISKLEMDDDIKHTGILHVEPEDLKGNFEFQINVESMQLTADEERKQARKAAIDTLSTNPNVHQMLAQEKVRPKFKELYVTWLEDAGFSDAERFFEDIEDEPAQDMPQPAQGAPAPSGAVPSGIPGGTDPNMGGENIQESPFSQTNNGLGPVSPRAVQQLAQNG